MKTLTAIGGIVQDKNGNQVEVELNPEATMLTIKVPFNCIDPPPTNRGDKLKLVETGWVDLPIKIKGRRIGLNVVSVVKK